MTRIFDAAQPGGGIRLLVLGAGHYPFAIHAQPKVPRLPDITSAARSAIDFATHALTDWRALFRKPLASVDLLVNDAAAPAGIAFACAGVAETVVDAPTMANIKRARTAWLKDAGRDDILIFYCAGHGIWLPSLTKTFLASDFGDDPETVWSNAVAIELFCEGMAEMPPREQWLIFDCCANEAPDGLQSARPSVSPLVESVRGRRRTTADLYGHLAQATIASAPAGASAFGRPDGRSRFMDMFIEACTGPGFGGKGTADRRWGVTAASLQDAMTTYRFRVASPEEDRYYTVALVITSEAPSPPALMVRSAPPPCLLLVTSEPAIKLKQGRLDILRGGTPIASQDPGPQAEERFRLAVAPYDYYSVNARWPPDLAFPDRAEEPFALPPLATVTV